MQLLVFWLALDSHRKGQAGLVLAQHPGQAVLVVSSETQVLHRRTSVAVAGISLECNRAIVSSDLTGHVQIQDAGLEFSRGCDQIAKYLPVSCRI